MAKFRDYKMAVQEFPDCLDTAINWRTHKRVEDLVQIVQREWHTHQQGQECEIKLQSDVLACQRFLERWSDYKAKGAPQIVPQTREARLRYEVKVAERAYELYRSRNRHLQALPWDALLANSQQLWIDTTLVVIEAMAQVS